MLRHLGTEAPRTSRYEHPSRKPTGVHRCAGCDAGLFRPANQCDSGTGWPGPTAPATPDAAGIRTG